MGILLSSFSSERYLQIPFEQIFPITIEQNFDRQTSLYYNWNNTILREKALGIKKKTGKAGR
jgi:hypothetical protein